jgi:hypothetical protein
MNDNKRFTIIIYAFSFILNLLLLFALFSSLNLDDLKHYFDSDKLYLPSLYRDLFIDHNGLKGWHLNPSPNFFPDMAIYFFLMFISGNFIFSSFLFSIIQYMVILLSIPFLFRILIPQVSRLFIALSVLFMTLFFFVTFFSHDFSFTLYILSNAYHTGVFTMGLICIILSLKYLKNPSKTKLVLLFFICFFSVLSDRLFIVVYSIPICTIVIFLVKRQYVREVYWLLLVNVVALIAGMAAFRFLDSSRYVFIDQANSFMNFANIGPSFNMLFRQLNEYLLGINFKSLIILLSIVSFTGTIILFFRKTGKHKHEKYLFLRFYCLFSITYTLVVLFMPVLVGNYTGYDTIRYNIYIFYLLVINTGIVAAALLNGRMMKRSVRMTVTLIPALFSLAVACIIVSEFSGKGLRQFFNYYPEIVRCVDDAAQKDKLFYGVGGYWDAKYITLFSKKGVHIYPVYDDLTPCNHVTNENWYTDRRAIFNFIIQNHIADSLKYRSRLGLTGEQLNSGEAQLIKVPPFRYEVNGYQIVWVK